MQCYSFMSFLFSKNGKLWYSLRSIDASVDDRVSCSNCELFITGAGWN